VLKTVSITLTRIAQNMQTLTTPRYKTEQEILNLVDNFRNQTLPVHAWTHDAHLVTALWFNKTYEEFEAICYLRSGIITYNVVTGGQNTPEKGYHETLTIFWCKIIREFINKNRELALVDLCDTLFKSEWTSKELPLQFYTRELLFSVKARATWVEPDKLSLA
jgi:hypothetical protein